MCLFMFQSAAPSLAGPLSELVSALLAGSIELCSTTWRQLLQLCVHSEAARPTWLTLARMMEVRAAIATSVPYR